MMHCEQSGCTGHLGKFDSCRDEALYELMLDGFGEWTGSDDFNGTYHAITLDEDTSTPLNGLPVEVTVPAGYYIVHTLSSGAVSVYTYDSAELMAADYELAEREYIAWDDQED